MPEFRKWILALAVIALFAGLASAQVGGAAGAGASSGTTFTCTTTNGAVTPTLRAEGFTELTGDIVIGCTGGTPLALGTAIPTANITIFLNTAVTSRLLQLTSNGTASEALLMIDEPGSSLTGYGPSVAQSLCAFPGNGAGFGGCTQIVGTVGANPGVPVNSSCLTAAVPCSAANGFGGASATAGPNIYQGVVSGNSVTFFGIPVMAPSSATPCLE